jgi:hypothetical protein
MVNRLALHLLGLEQVEIDLQVEFEKELLELNSLFSILVQN